MADFEFTVYTKPTGRPRGFFSEILEYGWVVWDEEQKTLLGEEQSFVKPKFFPKQAKEGQDFSMITQEDLKTGIEYDQMIERLRKIYRPGETYFVAWGDSDWHVIAEACARYGVENPLQPCDYLDLSKEYQRFFNLDYRPSLKNALDTQQIELSGIWHTALDDAKNTAKLVKHMLNLGWQVTPYEERGYL